MAKKRTTTKQTTTKKATKRKTAEPKATRAPKEDLIVFAIRLTKPERDKIHATAGPRNATHFIRAAAAAFANEDEGAFRATLKEARKLRG